MALYAKQKSDPVKGVTVALNLLEPLIAPISRMAITSGLHPVEGGSIPSSGTDVR